MKATHAFPDNGNYTVHVTVSDNGGGVSPTVATIAQVLNVAPTLTGVTLDQGMFGSGGPATISGLFADPGVLDTHTASVSWGDGGSDSQSLAANVLAFGPIAHTLGSPSGPLTLTVTDKDGGTASVPVPVVTALALSQPSILEGGSTTLNGSFSTSGDSGTNTVVITWGDGTKTTIPLAAGVTTFSASHPYADNLGPNGLGAISVAVTNTRGATAIAALPIAVANVAPTFPATGGPALNATSVVEGSSLALSGTFLDPGTIDTHTASIDWGDGSTPQLLNLAAGVTTIPNTSHRYLEVLPSAASVRVIVTDKDGASAEADFSVNVLGVAPKASVSSPNLLARSQVGTFNLNATSASPTAAAAGFSYVVDWGDGTSQTFAQAPGILPATHAYATSAPTPSPSRPRIATGSSASRRRPRSWSRRSTSSPTRRTPRRACSSSGGPPGTTRSSWPPARSPGP